jgi:hypothetical protein
MLAAVIDTLHMLPAVVEGMLVAVADMLAAVVPILVKGPSAFTSEK